MVTGKPPGPVVIIQGITLLDDSLARTIAGPVPTAPTTAALRDHVTVLVKPAALCFDPRRVDVGGLLVTPHFTGTQRRCERDRRQAALRQGRAREARRSSARSARAVCPKGRYAITLVYPTGQAWTVPNEMGGCAPSEGSVVSKRRRLVVRGEASTGAPLAGRARGARGRRPARRRPRDLRRTPRSRRVHEAVMPRWAERRRHRELRRSASRAPGGAASGTRARRCARPPLRGADLRPASERGARSRRASAPHDACAPYRAAARAAARPTSRSSRSRSSSPRGRPSGSRRSCSRSARQPRGRRR